MVLGNSNHCNLPPAQACDYFRHNDGALATVHMKVWMACTTSNLLLAWRQIPAYYLICIMSLDRDVCQCSSRCCLSGSGQVHVSSAYHIMATACFRITPAPTVTKETSCCFSLIGLTQICLGCGCEGICSTQYCRSLL